jgi:hypothetical protein
MTSRDGEPSEWARETARTSMAKFEADHPSVTDSSEGEAAETVETWIAELLDAIRSESHAAGRLEERERAARVCEARRDYWRRVYEGEVVHGTYPRGGDHCQEVGARGTEADACVALIRKEPNE